MTKGLHILLSIMVILFAIWLFTHIWTTRYELKTTGTDPASAYLLDTWTGEVKIIGGNKSYKIKPY